MPLTAQLTEEIIAGIHWLPVNGPCGPAYHQALADKTQDLIRAKLLKATHVLIGADAPEGSKIRETPVEWTIPGLLAEMPRRVEPAPSRARAKRLAKLLARQQRRIKGALKALEDGQIDGADHKAWTIDQAVRALTGDNYAQWVVDFCAGEDGPETYTWDEGIAP
jgi:hypothetical protein